MERNKAHGRKLEEERQSQLNARQLYDCIQSSAGSELLMSVMAAGQLRADDPHARKRRS